MSENDDTRGAFPHKEDIGRIQTVIFGRGYAHLKNSTFILSASVNEPYVVGKRFTTHFKIQLLAFQKGVSSYSGLDNFLEKGMM